METVQLDGEALKKMIIAASNELTENKALLDSLNVFPVPDGDTGTNMSLTALVAAREVEQLTNIRADAVAAAAASGSLRGARGNSGVILSQLFRGFARGIESKQVITTEDLAKALKQAVDTAYKAVMKPKEGTILTVASAVADKGADMAEETDDIVLMMREVISYGNIVLGKTTNMLPELKSAGVVDAGGKGLMCLLEGAYKGFFTDGNVLISEGAATTPPPVAMPVPAAKDAAEFGYCTEFFINLENADAVLDGLKQYLETVGDSIVVVGDDTIIKVHVHTEHPGTVLEHALTIGPLSSLKIENMSIQHSSLIEWDAPEPLAELGFVAVAAGEGIANYFEGLGVNIVIEGGQTMNPSTDDILEAIGMVNARDVIVLPNNRNIVLAAKQAAELCKDKNVHVLPTKTIPQGISAMVAYLPMNSAEDNIKAMLPAIEAVRTGLVTFAVRDTTVKDIAISEGDILCMSEGDIIHSDKDVQEGAKYLLDYMLQSEGVIASIFYGNGVTEEQAAQLSAYAQEKYPQYEIEYNSGGQPLYYYIFSVE